MSKKSADWWTACNCPYTGCPRLALKPEDRPEGCKKCWAPGFLSGRGGQTIHGGEDPGKLILWPNRLRKCLTTRKPQRYGWILGEPAEVCRAHPEYMAACVGVALARPDHGFGVPTSDPAALVEWARDMPPDGSGCILPQDHYDQEALRLGFDFEPGPDRQTPPNWIWLISASTQEEVNERAWDAAQLVKMGWRVGLHLEPLLGPINLTRTHKTDIGDLDLLRGGSWTDGRWGFVNHSDVQPLASWVAVGAPKGHTPTANELNWYRALRDQCAEDGAGIPFWLKSPLTLDGVEHRALPEGWPNS